MQFVLIELASLGPMVPEKFDNAATETVLNDNLGNTSLALFPLRHRLKYFLNFLTIST